ncbi:Glutathione S-transferase [[Luteovulum] sphaeroides subsp. megalophilum]|uniref:glutathione S-transferase n=1 Tax=Cereibacter sphaeroides TaxID=1063 RepID=UPI000B62DA54|nr:glutathione S-transferase [Cereibacter sphaeroides]MCE8421332.1 glutathione S-transferase [Rhodovulum sulfidophilum]RHZ99613.1 glutathione S-transferase [Cereibacter sphaeroides]SNS71326.1 Glutathione S-transferase [[Luteovulum] sphaeroides subsp. megalophilum]
MRLYASATSPFVRKVDVVLHETGLFGKVERILSGGTPVDPGNLPLALNPLGKIPVLARDDGPALYDSRVICRYLDSVANAGLYPAAPRLWDALTLEATADGILEAAVLMVYESRIRPEEKRHEPWVEGQWSKIARALEAVEARWMSQLQGPLDIGQIAMGCALDYLDFRHGPRDWRAARPLLAEWAGSFSQRPSMLATVPVA